MNDLIKLKTLKDIEDKYNIFFIDLWGVIHNGLSFFRENVKGVLERLKKKIKDFLLQMLQERLCYSRSTKRFGLSKNLYDHIVSSGEITWLSLKKNYEKKNAFDWSRKRLSFS